MEEGKKNPSFVTIPFCNERTLRIQKEIKVEVHKAKDEIITEFRNGLRKNNSMPWKAKASIVVGLISGVTAIIVAYIK